MEVRQPPPLLSLVHTKVKWFSKTVKKFGSLYHFLDCVRCFWWIFACTVYHSSIHTLSFLEMKVLRLFICHVSFIYIWLVISEFSYLKCFRTSRKYQYRLLLGGFLSITPRNVVKLVWNFWPVMLHKVMRQMFDSFYSILKKWSKLVKKNWFSCSFLEVFCLQPLMPDEICPNLLRN